MERVDRASVSEKVMAELRVLAFDLWEKEFEFLVAAATKIACAVCSGKQPQYVIKKLLWPKDGKKTNAYRILFGMREGSSRHGLNEVGMIYAPKEKQALSKAIKDRVVIAVNNVTENALTDYMVTHAKKKNIRHLAVIPIPMAKTLPGIFPEWLIIIDRVECDWEFNSGEIQFLKEHREADLHSLPTRPAAATGSTIR